MPRLTKKPAETKLNLTTRPNGESEVSSRLLQRGIDILEYLADNPHYISTTELAEKLEMHPSTCHRLLKVLKQRGYVDQDDQFKHWSLGMAVLRLSGSIMANLDLRRAARGPIEELCRQTRETVFLGILNRGEVVYIDKVESPQAVNIALAIGAHLRLHATSLGRVLMAYSGSELFQQEIGRGLYKLTPYTLSDADILQQKLTQIRLKGYEQQSQESFEGVGCVAVPIFGHEGKIVAAIGVAGPVTRLTEQAMNDLIIPLKATAARISSQMGFTADYALMSRAEAPQSLEPSLPHF